MSATAAAHRRSGATRFGYRWWFTADGLVTGLNAVAYLVLSSILPGPLGAASTVYLAAGAVLAAVTVGLFAVARTASSLWPLPWLLIMINVVWAVGSLVIAVADPFGLTVIGRGWVVVQAAVVGGFAIAQFLTCRRARSSGPGAR